MPELPEGPVTIMFTDTEDSTALRTSLGDAATDELFRAHDELIRAQIDEHRGHDQKAALGDGFLAVFVSTKRAISCAIAIQKALDAFNRSRPGPPLKVRIGLNTGEVAWHSGQLSGEAVHAAARVCSAGQGGQILVSDVTRQLAGTIPDVTFHDAGEHQLKGFPAPWRLYEVVWVRETPAAPAQVFVGREKELEMLRAKLVSALEGKGGLVLVGGEPGVGKTTLVRRLIAEAEQRGALAVFGRCYESEGAVPYSPFVEMLEQALAVMPPEIVREDLAEDAPEVARLVPELRRRFPDIGEPLDLPPEQQRRYFFNAVGSFVSRGAARFPLLMVMDDVHWADEPTLLLIEHMAALMPDLRVLGVGTYRDVELEVSRPLAASLDRMLRARLVERIPVKRFDRDGVARMIGALSGRHAPESVVTAIFDETEGNPFFVEEVYRHLVEEGKVFDGSGEFRTDLEVDELDVPESVRLVVGRRLERLGDVAQKALAAGAVVGRAFPFTFLEEISEIDPGTLLDIVEEAEAARVIVPEERDGEIHYFFAHELIRQTLLSSLSLLRRQRLHLSIANAIERTDPTARTERPSEIAHHLLQAGAAAPAARTLEYIELTVERAMAAAAFEEALRALDDGLSLAEGDPARRARLLELKGKAVRALGGFEEALSIWSDVMAVYRENGDALRAGRLAWDMGYIQIWMGRFEAAFSTYAHGLEALGDEMIPERALLTGGAGTIAGFAGLFDVATQQYEEGQRLARELGDRRAMGAIEWGRCVVAWTGSDVAEAERTGAEAIEHLRAAEDPWILVDALAWYSLPLAFIGRADEAIAVCDEAITQAVTLGQLGAELIARRSRAIAEHLVRPDLAKARAAAEWDLQRCEAIRSPWVSQSHDWLATCAYLAGDLEAASRHSDESVRLEPVSAWSGLGWGYRLTTRAFAGDQHGCLEMLAEPLPALSGPDELMGIGPLMQLITRVHISGLIGSVEHASTSYPLLLERAHRVPGSLFDAVIAERALGMAAGVLGQWDDAERHFENALVAVGKFNNRLDEPNVHHWYGRMLLQRGRPEDRERAVALIRSARDVYDARGMAVHLRMADEALAGVPGRRHDD